MPALICETQTVSLSVMQRRQADITGISLVLIVLLEYVSHPSISYDGITPPKTWYKLTQCMYIQHIT